MEYTIICNDVISLTYFLLTYLFTYLLTHLLTPWSRVLREKAIASQLVKKLPAFYGTRKFITAFTSARHLYLSWASWIQPMPPHPTSWRSILILSSHLPTKKYTTNRIDVISLWRESTGRTVATLTMNTNQIRMSEITIRHTKANIFQQDKAKF